MKTKAAETNLLLGFVVQALERRGQRVDQRDALLGAGRCLAEYDAVVHSMPRRMSVSDTQRLLAILKRYTALAGMAGVPPIPKFHLWLHMVLRTSPLKTIERPND